MTNPFITKELTKKISKYINKLAGLVKFERQRLTFKMEQVYLWSIFRFYYLPLYICEILDKQ